MIGTWRVTNTISRFTMPLGESFVDGFTQAVAAEDVTAAIPLTYSLRFVEAEPAASDPDLCVAQDRRYNAIEETNAFLGSDGGAVRRGSYAANEAYPHGRLLLEIEDPAEETGGGGGKGAAPTLSKLDIAFDWVGWDRADSGAFVTSELVRQRSLRPAGLYEEALDEESFLEIITSFNRKRGTTSSSSSSSSSTPEVLQVRNRLVQYLEFPIGGSSSVGRGASIVEAEPAGRANRSRSAEAMRLIAAGRATSFFDYDWRMERVDNSGEGQRRLDFGSPRFT